MTRSKNKVVILGIDNFSYKNTHQAKCLNSNNFILYVFTNDVLKNSSENLDQKINSIKILKKYFFNRIIQVNSFLRQNKDEIHHVEIYPGSRFSFVYLIISKAYKLKSLVVERGDISLYKEKFFTKFSMWFCYKFSDLVWYRESYKNLDVKKQLIKWGAKKIIFIPNAVPLKKFKKNYSFEYVFLWANRFLKERKVKWFVDCVNEIKFSKSIMLGIMNKAYGNEKYALDNKSKYLDVVNYQKPDDFYLKSKFFVFPSDVVFLNNSLIEAMSYGMVPLISNVQSSELIVDDGIDGFIFDHSKDGLLKAMKKALNLTQTEYKKMSENAIVKIERSFSYEVWCKNYLSMINESLV